MKVFRIKLTDYTPFAGEPDPLWTAECPDLVISADNIMSLTRSTADVIIYYDNATNFDRITITCADPDSASGTAAATRLKDILYEGLKYVHSNGFTDVAYDIVFENPYIEDYRIG